MAGASSTGVGPPDGPSSRPEPGGPPISILRIRLRRDFVRAREGVRVSKPAFLLQAILSAEPGSHARVGFTVTKQIGNAVTRNRARRRLKEAARALLPLYARAGHDYVLIGRAEALVRPFPDLIADLKDALIHAHRAKPRASRTGPDRT